MLEKLLIFTKLLLKSFIYELAETFAFQKETFKKYTTNTI